MADPIFDPVTGPKWILDGRIVPMTGENDVIADGHVYINGGVIEAVQAASAAAPAGYEGIKPINSGGTIFPGLIELHNHLPYNVLPLWKVPKEYQNRDQWGRHPDYRKLISGPMNVLGRTDGLVQAVVRWVEVKALLSGTTTSQGIALFSNAGIRKYYRGLVRNAEETNDEDLPEAATKIGDVAASSAVKFRARLESKAAQGKKLILHLAEGRSDDDAANDHFRALKIDSRTWAINEALVGIHCTALRSRNFATLRARKGSIVWSPLSNLLLYGKTTDIGRALAEGLRVSLGSDWSPSGSKNLLMEMKTARLHSDDRGVPVTNFQIAQMVTTNPADMLGWGDAVGTIEPGKRADLMVVAGKSGDPYDRLLAARESSVVLVVINGVRRSGQVRLMKGIAGLEHRKVGGSQRRFNLAQDNIEQSVAGLSLGDAEGRLRDAFARLPELARDLERGAITSLAMGSGKTADVMAGTGATLPSLEGNWFLDLDHIDGPGAAHRPKLTIERMRTGVFAPSVAAGVPLSELLGPIELDELSAQDDSVFWATLAVEQNLPVTVRDGLFAAYRKSAPPPPPSTSLAASSTVLPENTEEGGPLTLDERLTLVDQAIVLLDQTYVHLPLKRSLHAVDPIQRLRLLRYRLSQQDEDSMGSEVAFHSEMSRIFTSVRDLHTNYLLPQPYRSYTAVLPFFLEECFDTTDPDHPIPHYVVSKVAPDQEHPTFEPGVEILNWNGLPIRRAVELNAERQAGSNEAAAFARGLDAMTVRPLITTVPPDEDWVTITYQGLDDEVRQVRKEWRLIGAGRDSGPALSEASHAALGLDLQTALVGETRKHVYAPKIAAAEEAASSQFVSLALAMDDDQLETHLPGVFRAKLVNDGQYGYIRIFTFGVGDIDAFVAEFARLVELMPDAGLIVDVRGNGGGAIAAAERILQTMTPRHIRPARAQFTTSPLLLDLCRRHGPSPDVPDLDLAPWVDSLQQAVATGSEYSRGFPITDEKAANDRGQRYHGPVVLIVDALSYSATDILAAGFIDHRIGLVLGTADNTGAGGANVWRHSDLLYLAGNTSDLQPLPRDAEMRVSVRRITRVGEAEGEVLEDLGIRINQRHYMSRDDVLGSNDDLIRSAIKLLRKQTPYQFRTSVARRARGRLVVKVETSGVDSIEVRIGGKAAETLEPTTATHSVRGLPTKQTEVELIGYSGSEIIARRRDLV
jgi:cytosine/adenosine deaminase-related metal-dependent hydrolase